MSASPVADVSATVDYSTDKWLLDRIPWAMWFVVGGMAFVLNAKGSVLSGALSAFVYLGLLGIAFAGWAITTTADRSTSFWPSLAIGIAIAVAVALIIALVAGVGRTSAIRGTLWWGQLVDPPPHVFGWMLTHLGIAYIAYAVFRHHHPGRPVVRLTPIGVTINRSWLRALLVPWQNIRRVGYLDAPRPGEPSYRNTNAAVIEVSRAYYDEHVAPKRRLLAPPGSEAMFQPGNDGVQIVLSSTDVDVAVEDYLAPLEARWTAYRHGPSAPPGGQGPPVVHGRWSRDGSSWQLFRFTAPVAGLAAVILHSLGG